MTASEMLSKIGRLPPISKAGLELGSLLGRADQANDEIVSIIEQDPVLTAKLLRICNSPSIGLRDPVESVNQAVLLLGYDQIAQMVTALAYRSSLAMPLQAYAMAADDLWRHSVATANAARLVVRKGLNFEVESSVAFTVGLLHDIGKVVVNEFMTRQVGIALRQAIADGETPIDAERKALGTDHAEVGAALLHMWRLPDALIEAVGCHHRPVLQPRVKLSALASFANSIAHKGSSEATTHDWTLEDQAGQALGITSSDAEQLLTSCGAESRSFPEEIATSA